GAVGCKRLSCCQHRPFQRKVSIRAGTLGGLSAREGHGCVGVVAVVGIQPDGIAQRPLCMGRTLSGTDARRLCMDSHVDGNGKIRQAGDGQAMRLGPVGSPIMREWGDLFPDLCQMRPQYGPQAPAPRMTSLMAASPSHSAVAPESCR